MTAKLFKAKKKVITLVEISDEWLKIVQALPATKDRKINKAVVERISGLEDSRIAATLSRLAKDLQVNPELLTVCVPHQLAAIRNIELPSTNPEEIKDMVDLQIGKQTPFSKDEIIYDFSIITTNTEGYSKVMLTIVRQGWSTGSLRFWKKLN